MYLIHRFFFFFENCVNLCFSDVTIGNITMGGLINVIPFTKKLIKISITGETLWDAFEHSVSDYLEVTHKCFQVSGD